MRYFVAGNLWLLAALLVLVGRTGRRAETRTYAEGVYGMGTVYSVFGLGMDFTSAQYKRLLASLACLSVAFFALAAWTRARPRASATFSDTRNPIRWRRGTTAGGEARMEVCGLSGNVYGDGRPGVRLVSWCRGQPAEMTRHREEFAVSRA